MRTDDLRAVSLRDNLVSPGSRLSWLLRLAFFAGVGLAMAADLTTEQQASLRAGHRHDKSGWVYLHIEGAPRARGFQYGFLLSREIAEGLRVTRAIWAHDSGLEWPWFVAKSRELIEPQVDPESLAELDGMAEGCEPRASRVPAPN